MHVTTPSDYETTCVRVHADLACHTVSVDGVGSPACLPVLRARHAYRSEPVADTALTTAYSGYYDHLYIITLKRDARRLSLVMNLTRVLKGANVVWAIDGSYAKRGGAPVF